ncbi:MAG: ChaN family lipoprotein [Pseudomonadota bacterium]
MRLRHKTWRGGIGLSVLAVGLVSLATAPLALRLATPERGVDLNALCPDIADGAARVWLPSSAAPALVDQIAAADIILIGELHDSALHHQVQACVLKLSAATKMPPAVVWEHLTTDQQDTLDAFAKSGDRSADAFAKAVAWDKSGWPPFKLFRPIVDVALSSNLPMYGGNVRGPVLMKAARSRGRDVPDALRPLLERKGAMLDEAASASLRDELVKSHCNMLPANAIDSMIFAQQFRDVQLAKVTADAFVKHGRVVVIAGNGHVRGDRGVPFHLKRFTPEARVLTIIQHETATPGTFPKDAPRQDFGQLAGRLLSDVMVATSETKREGACEMMQRMMQSRAKPKASE